MDTTTVAAEEVQGAPATRADVQARPEARTLALRFLLVGGLVLLDLWTKAAVFRWMERAAAEHALPFNDIGREHYPLAGDWLSFMLSLNPGAAFGHLDSFPWLLVAGRIGAALFLIWMIVRSAKGRPVFNAALLLVLAGALGNLYDNLFRARDLVKDAEHEFRRFGPVRDFIDVYFRVWDWHFPTFNVADSCITVGACLLFVCALFDGKQKPSANA